MNIGLEGKTNKTDKKGVSILTEILSENDNFECHFKDEDKVPNSDGFFILTKENIPNRRFDVQIKSTKKVNKLKDGTISFSFDTKFINYANLGVTTDPCIIFHPDVTSKKIYFKILTEDFLEKNYFIESDQKNVSIHFDPKNEVIDDIDDFYKILDAFTQYKKSFNIKKINIINYQKSFDFINRFFETDFHKVRKIFFPKVWKFGIAYQKIEKPTFLKHSYMYGVFKILFGEKTLPFQQINDFSTSKLNYISGFESNSISEENIEEIMNTFVGNFLDDFFSNINNCVPFLPNDALFEILFNFYDSWNPSVSTEILSILDFEKAFFDNLKCLERTIVKCISLCLQTLKNRDINLLNRVFNKVDYSRLWDTSELQNLYDNNAKLFSKLSSYYNEFCNQFFDDKKESNVAFFGQYKILLSINYEPNILNETYISSMTKSDENISISIVTNENDVICFNQLGHLDTDFRGRTNNIANAIITMLYKALCRNYHHEIANLGYKTFVNNFNPK